MLHIFVRDQFTTPNPNPSRLLQENVDKFLGERKVSVEVEHPVGMGFCFAEFDGFHLFYCFPVSQEAIGAFTEMLQKYKLMEASIVRQKASLKQKVRGGGGGQNG